MREHPPVAAATVAALRKVCAGLPESYEEPAWVGTRWRIRTKTFAHIVEIADGRPQAFARAAAHDGPLTVLTFRSSGEELAALTAAGPPFFKPPWWGDIIGVVIDEHTDWDEIAELVTESYCTLAPKKLAAAVRPE